MLKVLIETVIEINTFGLQSTAAGSSSSLDLKMFWDIEAWRVFVALKPLKRTLNSSTVRSAYSLMPTVKVWAPAAASVLCFSTKAKFFSQVDLRWAWNSFQKSKILTNYFLWQLGAIQIIFDILRGELQCYYIIVSDGANQNVFEITFMSHFLNKSSPQYALKSLKSFIFLKNEKSHAIRGVGVGDTKKYHQMLHGEGGDLKSSKKCNVLFKWPFWL